MNRIPDGLYIKIIRDAMNTTKKRKQPGFSVAICHALPAGLKAAIVDERSFTAVLAKMKLHGWLPEEFRNN